MIIKSIELENFRNYEPLNISFDEYGAFERAFQPLNPGYGPYNMARSHYKFDPERQYILHDPDLT